MRECVYCRTQEEWDITSTKLGRTSDVNFRRVGDSIQIDHPNASWFNHKYQDDAAFRFIDFSDWYTFNYEIF